MNVTRLRAGAAGLLLMVAVAACSSGASPSGVATLQSPGTANTGNAGNAGSSTAPSASLDPEAAQLAFARCMRDNGVDMPDPVAGGAPGGGGGTIAVGGDGIDAKKMQAAFEACQKFLGSAGGSATQIDPAMQDKMLKFAGCMRDHGIDFPDPVISGGGVSMTVGGSATAANAIDPTSTKFQDASKACQPILGDLPGLSGTQMGGGGAGPGVVISGGGAQPVPVAP
jgi:hypothetical protein